MPSVPIVLLDRQVTGIQADWVGTDSEEAAYIATRHLIQIGHRKIGVVTFPPVISTGQERLNGYLRALSEFGISADSSSIVISENYQPDGAREAVKKLISSANRPTAVFATSSLMTLGCLQGIKDLGLDIPEDIALVGFDDFDWYLLCAPAISTMAQDTYKLGFLAAEVLIARISRKRVGDPEKFFIPGQLIIRESCLFIS